MSKVFETNNKLEPMAESDYFKEFEKLIVEVQIKDRKVPVLGRLIRNEARYIVLERRNGSSTVINKQGVLLIQATSNNPGVVV